MDCGRCGVLPSHCIFSYIKPKVSFWLSDAMSFLCWAFFFGWIKLRPATSSYSRLWGLQAGKSYLILNLYMEEDLVTNICIIIMMCMQLLFNHLSFPLCNILTFLQIDEPILFLFHDERSKQKWSRTGTRHIRYVYSQAKSHLLPMWPHQFTLGKSSGILPATGNGREEIRQIINLFPCFSRRK